MRLSQKARRLLPTIEEACEASADDQGMSRYFGVPLYEILAIRQNLAEKELAERSDEQVGCDVLRDATLALFKRWERANGFQNGAGEKLFAMGHALGDEMALAA